MGKINKPKKVKLISSIISNDIILFNEVEEVLIKYYGEIDFSSDIIPFTHTQYYNKEMGGSLTRKFISFRSLIYPDEIANIKIRTNGIEEEYLKGTNRSINIDPGYISLAKLVLASTKNYSHRIYLTKGIYAETTLHFHKGIYETFQFTYPDYATNEVRRVFGEIREVLKYKLRCEN